MFDFSRNAQDFAGIETTTNLYALSSFSRFDRGGTPIMTSKSHEPGTTDRCATDKEIYQAGAAQRILSLETARFEQSDTALPSALPGDGSPDQSVEDAMEESPPDTIFREVRSETGEWVQVFAFELDFFATLEKDKHRGPGTN
jgi:hypothetical protein